MSISNKEIIAEAKSILQTYLKWKESTTNVPVIIAEKFFNFLDNHLPSLNAQIHYLCLYDNDKLYNEIEFKDKEKLEQLLELGIVVKIRYNGLLKIAVTEFAYMLRKHYCQRF